MSSPSLSTGRENNGTGQENVIHTPSSSSPSLYNPPTPPFSPSPSPPSYHRAPPLPHQQVTKHTAPFSLPSSLSPRLVGRRSELADLQDPTSLEAEPEEERNKWVVRALYEAFNSRDVETVQRLLNPDLEWRFHGPPSHQHMMRVLTGKQDRFVFVPSSIAAFGDTVLVEGTDPRSPSVVFWVHAWTVGPDGIITQLREYFNTSLTVTRLSKPQSPSTSTQQHRSCYVPLWQSRVSVSGSAGKSVPGLVLAL